MKWTDIHEIAIALAELHPEIDPKFISFTDLHRWVTRLPEFNDQAQGSSERILEAIQMAWLAEVA